MHEDLAKNGWVRMSMVNKEMINRFFRDYFGNGIQAWQEVDYKKGDNYLSICGNNYRVYSKRDGHIECDVCYGLDELIEKY